MKFSSTSAAVVSGLVVAVLGGGVAVYGTRADAIADAARMRAAEAAAATLPEPTNLTTVPADAARPGGPLQGQAEAIMGSGAAEWTLMAYDIDRHQTLFAINADKPSIPASNNKVYGAIWALDIRAVITLRTTSVSVSPERLALARSTLTVNWGRSMPCLLQIVGTWV